MNVLILAPQPFFQERGTPIAVRFLSEALAQQIPNAQVRLLTFHGGEDIELQGVRHSRMWAPRWLGPVRPGASLKKFTADFFFFWATLREIARERPTLIHAVEEASFIGFCLKQFKCIPYIYDMDSLLSGQLVERWEGLKFLQPLFRALESIAIRSADAVVAVCPALAEEAAKLGAKRVELLSDFAIDAPSIADSSTRVPLRQELGIARDEMLSLYVGNLEHYQGIDLALESFVRVLAEVPKARLAIVGGVQQHIAQYREKAQRLGISAAVFFAGPRPVADLPELLREADVLISPRLKGINTPMKLYSYLASGKAILATKLLTHTQVLNQDVACLAESSVADFSRHWAELLTNPQRLTELGARAQALAQEKYSMRVFRSRVGEIYSSFQKNTSGVQQ